MTALDSHALVGRAAAIASSAATNGAQRFLTALVTTTRVKLGEGDPASLEDMPPSARLALLLDIAASDRAPREALLPLISSTVDELRDRGHEHVAALGLWADLERAATGYDALNPEVQALALERCLAMGHPRAVGDAVAWVEGLLAPGRERDDVLLNLLQRRAEDAQPGAVARWLPVVDRIASPWVRARALLELAVRTPMGAATEEDDALVGGAEAAFEEAIAEPAERLWRGYPKAMLGGVVTRRDPTRAAELMASAWQDMYRLVEPAPRMQAYQGLLLAATQQGLAAWSRAMQTLRRDLPLRTDPRRLAQLVFEAAGLAKRVRCSSVVRSAILVPVGALVDRVKIPEWQALVYAAFAETTSHLTDWPPTNMFERMEGALRTTVDPQARARMLPQLARLCGSADVRTAVAMVELCRTDEERVRWLLAVAEANPV